MYKYKYRLIILYILEIEIYYTELAHAVMEAEKSPDLPSGTPGKLVV